MKQITWEKLDFLKTGEELEELDLDLGGLIDLNKLATTNRFNFWVGYTNFQISIKDFHELDNSIEGIESLVVISPLRFIVSVGKMFDENVIKEQVEKILCSIPFKFDTQLRLTIDKIQTSLNKYKQWIIYILPCGNIEYAFLDKNAEEFAELVEVYKLAQETYGGRILVP